MVPGQKHNHAGKHFISSEPRPGHRNLMLGQQKAPRLNSFTSIRGTGSFGEDHDGNPPWRGGAFFRLLNAEALSRSMRMWRPRPETSQRQGTK
jgi:hypothetical protein